VEDHLYIITLLANFYWLQEAAVEVQLVVMEEMQQLEVQEAETVELQ